MKPTRETRQKEVLKRELGKINAIFTAEELYKKTADKENKLGIATVYRFLKELRTKGQLHSYICARKIIYSKKQTSHCHFICEKCGKLEHISLEKIDFIKEKIKGKICHFQLDISGICEKCAKII
ncbi:MAG: transcriptional repressor [Nanoarchaeota archaeon]